MKLFGEFEAVYFSEENLIFIVHSGYLYYIYNPNYKRWTKYVNAGSDRISVHEYQDISEETLINATKGVFPSKETDFLRLCDPAELNIRDMMTLLTEDYPEYLSEYRLLKSVHKILLQVESDVCYKVYLRMKSLFDNATVHRLSRQDAFNRLKKLSINFIGRDIFKKEIEIVDGHDGSSYFWIMPARVIDFTDSDHKYNVAEMRSNEISIEEGDVNAYLSPFLYKYFEETLEANKKRVASRWKDEDGIEQCEYIKGFEWYLTHNFYTYESMNRMLHSIRDTMVALESGCENEFTIKIKRIDEDVTVEMILDFYQRFIYRLEYMIRVGTEKGYNLISVMGP